MTLKFMLVNNLSSFFSPTNLMSILESVQIFNRVIRKLTFLIVFLLFFYALLFIFSPVFAQIFDILSEYGGCHAGLLLE